MVHYILIKFKTFWTLSGQSTIMSMLSLYNVQVSGQSTMSMLSLQVNFRLTFIFSFSTSFETASTISMKVPTIFWKSAISEWGKFKENITKNYHLNKCVIHKLLLLWHFNKHCWWAKESCFRAVNQSFILLNNWNSLLHCIESDTFPINQSLLVGKKFELWALKRSNMFRLLF